MRLALRRPLKHERGDLRMSSPVQLYCWHFMSYPHLAPDFDDTQSSGWVTVPNSLWDRQKARGLYQQYIDQLAYADEVGFDGMVLNEHHQTIYGLGPSPNLVAAALTQRTKKGKIDAHPIWAVTVIMPKKLMQDVYIGKENKDHNQMAELMRYDQSGSMTTDEAAQENTDDVEETPQ
jgi:hypothetical protein